MLSPSAVEGPQGDKRPESGECCHHRLWKDLVVTEKTRKWCMLSSSVVEKPCSDRKDQKLVLLAMEQHVLYTTRLPVRCAGCCSYVIEGTVLI